MSSNKSILLVNTDTDTSSKWKRVLPNLGVDVAVANTFESARLQVDNGTFDLILIFWDKNATASEVRVRFVRELRASGVKTPIMATDDPLGPDAGFSVHESRFAVLDDFDYVYSELAKRVHLYIRNHEREGRSSTWRLGINNHLNDHIVPADKTTRVTESDTRALQALFASSRIAPAFDRTSDGWKDDLRMVKTGLSNLLKRVGNLGEGA
jgi:hypothetical protein